MGKIFDLLPKEVSDYASELTKLSKDTGLSIFNNEITVKAENDILYTIRLNMETEQFEVVSSEDIIEHCFYDAYICEQACKYRELYDKFQENSCHVGNIYRFTDGDMSEYCVAKTKVEAFDLFENFWDEGTMASYITDFFTKNPSKLMGEFIEENIHLEFPETLITDYDTHENTVETKMAVEWALDYMTIPAYLFHSKW